MNKKFKEYKEQKRKQRTYTFTQAQIDQMKKELVEKAMKQAQEEILLLFLAIPVKILKEHYSFSKKKLGNFCEFVSDYYESLELGKYDLEECKELLWEECGMKFVINE